MNEPDLVGMPDVSLTLDAIHIERGELRIPYVLENRGSSAIYALNLLADRYGQLGGRPGDVPTPALAQTCMVEPGVVLMRLGIVPPPMLGPEISMFGNPKPRASKIAAGAGFAATVRARLPLVEWSETWMPMRDAPENVPTAITTLRLQVECAREADVAWVREDDDAPGSFSIGAARSELVQIEADVAELGVVLLAHPRMYRLW